MTLITLERPDIYNDMPITKNNIKRTVIKQRPVTINPEYIVSMTEHFDNSKEFDYTEINLSNSAWYYVTSRIEEIVAMIKEKRDET